MIMTGISVVRILPVLSVLLLSCSDVRFQSQQAPSTTGPTPSSGCRGSDCPEGTYGWFQGGFGACSRACGAGTRNQLVECRRTGDSVAVPDYFCRKPRPAASESCNVQTCTQSYSWNAGPFGACSTSCGTCVRTRSVFCQNNQTGAQVLASNCKEPRPSESEIRDQGVCPPTTYSWKVEPGDCSRECGGGTATDSVICKRNDGASVAESFCASRPKPPTARVCNTQACPHAYTYVWETGSWSECSKECGTGTQSRWVACKRMPDGVYVQGSLCGLGSKPESLQNCPLKECPTG
ncbi:MAG: thrombospondin type-1 domain-containing protein, partial [Bdellovibrionales bacterium]